MTLEDINHGLIAVGSSELIRRMDQRLELVNRLLDEIKENAYNQALGLVDRIDAEMARRFLDNPDSVDLSKPKLIDDDAAEILAVYDRRINLNGLTSLSDTAAESLSKHHGYQNIKSFFTSKA